MSQSSEVQFIKASFTCNASFKFTCEGSSNSTPYCQLSFYLNGTWFPTVKGIQLKSWIEGRPCKNESDYQTISYTKFCINDELSWEVHIMSDDLNLNLTLNPLNWTIWFVLVSWSDRNEIESCILPRLQYCVGNEVRSYDSWLLLFPYSISKLNFIWYLHHLFELYNY